MNKIWMVALLCALGGVSIAQDNWCGFDYLHQKEMSENPQSRQAVEDYVSSVHQGSALNRTSRAGEKVIVPTVIHVTYSDCEGDISLAQIQDALKVLNDDFNRQNFDTNETRPEFIDYAASTTVEFRLAQIDPDGNPTEGINRIESSLSVNANNGIKSVENWPSDRYFNIWVVESIQNFGGGAGTILGYAQFPNGGNWSTYGIVIRNDAMGRVGTSSADGRTLTHEVGHCFGLYHTFQSGCGGSCNSSGDFICDTPPAQSDPTYDCSTGTNTCSNDQAGASPYTSNVPDQIENYMSYNSCQNMFTIGQRDVMVSTVESVSRLQNLVSEDNLIATGVVGLKSAGAITDKLIICEGSPIQISQNASYDAQTFDWNFGGNAIPQQSASASTEVIFYESGLQNINFEMSKDSLSQTGTDAVFVLDKIGQYVPYLDDMEAQSNVPSDQWFAVNNDLDARVWRVTDQAAFSGEKSLTVDNFGMCGTHSDYLFTQSLDLSVYSTATLNFKTSFAQVDESNNDFLRISVSKDCGETWNLIWVQGGASLAGINTPQTSAYTPVSLDQWKEQSIPLNATYMLEGLVVRFEFVGRGGNNFYFDDFEITGEYSGDLLLLYPENNKEGLASDVKLDWKAVGGVDFYEYQLDNTTSFNSGNEITGTKTYIDQNPTNADTEFEAFGLTPNTTYYWRVRYSLNGTFGDWSDIWKFKISESGVGVEENLEGETVMLYPNPTKGLATVSSSNTLLSVELYDYTGRLISNQQNVNATQVQLDLSDVKSGMYLVIVNTTNGIRTVKPLIVQ
jgi:hypothetical protein